MNVDESRPDAVRRVHGQAMDRGRPASQEKHAMRSKGAFAALGLAALFTLVSLGAAAQGTNIYVAAQPPFDTLYPGFDVSPTIQEAVNKAIASAAAVYEHYEVLVDANGGAAWAESLNIYADADITLRGVTSPLSDTSQDAVIDPPVDSQSAIEITPPLSSFTVTNRLVVEGFTLTGGFAGFHAMHRVAPTLNRVYIKDNVGDGVLCEDGSYVLLVNCSIVQNAVNGVEVVSNSSARLVFCTVYANGRSGMYVDSSALGGSAGDVINSIVFQNAQSGLEWTAPPAIVNLDSNDVFDNGASAADDYINVAPDANSIKADPILWPPGGGDPAPWVGALQASECIYGIYGIYDIYNVASSPVIDVADAAIVIPAPTGPDYTSRDFEGDIRPQAYRTSSALPDMGADEVRPCGPAWDLPMWTDCLINPNPKENNNPQPVGKAKLEANQLKVRIGISRSTTEAISLYLVPQGGDPNNPAHRIPLPTRTTLTTNYYEFENSATIDPAAFGALSGVIDGHAMAYLVIGDYTYGLTSDQLIGNKALVGRHTIIDTMPPRMVAPAPDDGLTAAPPLVAIFNAQPQLTAAGGAATAGHPVSPAFPMGWLPATDPAPVWAPPILTPPNYVYDGRITQGIYLNALGAQVFTNAGSLSNDINGDSLNLRVTVEFEDLPPPNTTDRVVSGFPKSNIEPSNGPDNSIAKWTPTALFAAAAAQCVYTTSGDNFGYDPNSPGGSGDISYNYNNSRTKGEWTFVDANTSLPSLGFDRAPAQALVRFRGIDRAGNITEEDKQLEPLQIWWMIEAHSSIQPNQEGQTIPSSQFSVQMAGPRPVVDPVAAANGPLFTYRFYTAPAKTGPYTPLGTWAAWTPWTSTSGIPDQGTDFGGQWVLLVTLAADEAGNVEKWPAELGAPDNPVSVGESLSGQNWMRFRIGAGNLDTSISPSFWHDWFNKGTLQTLDTVSGVQEASFGGQIIPSPAVVVPVTDPNAAYVAGLFRINMQSATPSANLYAVWSLYAAGAAAPTRFGVVRISAPQVLIPDLVPLFPANLRLEDANAVPQARTARNWVFTAATFIDDPATGTVGAWDGGEPIDTTPASFAFTVVPQTSLESYVRNRESMDRQPIKVQEVR
jgi:hypothetical protein